VNVKIRLMNSKILSYIALVCAIAAIVLQLEGRARFNERVERIVAERERESCAQLATKLNEARELMGLKPVSPTTFAEVLSFYFESMATVMSGGVSVTPATGAENKK
jgi:hypothetical protein